MKYLDPLVFYHPCTEAEFISLTSPWDLNKRVDFTEKEINIILDITKLKMGTSRLPGVISLVSSNFDKLDLYKLDDEWYFVRYSTPLPRKYFFYNCDQFEGLLRCLQNIQFDKR